MEIFILVDYSGNNIIEVGSDYFAIIKTLNRYLNQQGYDAILPDLLRQELKLKPQVEIKAGNKLFAVAISKIDILA